MSELARKIYLTILLSFVVAACAETHEDSAGACATPGSAGLDPDAGSATELDDDAGESAAAQDAGIEEDADQSDAAVDVSEEPTPHSLGWTLRQPYMTCGDGARATDNPESLYVAHPTTGLCTFPCSDLPSSGSDDAPTITEVCVEHGGACDELGFCVPEMEL